MFLVAVIKQYERAVIFRLGRYIGTRQPGLTFLIPILDHGIRVDMREMVIDEPAQSSITKDNAIVDIDYVVYMRLVDAEAAVINVQDYVGAVRNLATTTLRSVIGEMTVEQVLSERDAINQRLEQKLSEVTIRWGVEVKAVEIREVSPQHDIQNAMTRLLTADRTKRALVTESEGDRQAAINRAEGSKQASILEAEGDKEAQILRAEGGRQASILNAEGFSIGLQRIYETAARVDQNTMALQYLDMMRSLGQGPSTKWIIPMDLANAAAPLASALAGMAGRNGPPAGTTGGPPAS
ncbi:MAG: SPFH/Band 7/PHB domain protein [Chloroflexi bacterium]|nr:SPFH/Band 7/PHB domain protein [Chloroflexota bacterium]MDA1240472.1 SPFH/Band 7/PHB domain protein [Chloroflexota bacterium]